MEQVSADEGTPEGTDAVLRRVRVVCVRCGADVQAIAGRATMGGSCTTCGGYELIPAPPADAR